MFGRAALLAGVGAQVDAEEEEADEQPEDELRGRAAVEEDGHTDEQQLAHALEHLEPVDALLVRLDEEAQVVVLAHDLPSLLLRRLLGRCRPREVAEEVRVERLGARLLGKAQLGDAQLPARPEEEEHEQDQE